MSYHSTQRAVRLAALNRLIDDSIPHLSLRTGERLVLLELVALSDLDTGAIPRRREYLESFPEGPARSRRATAFSHFRRLGFIVSYRDVLRLDVQAIVRLALELQNGGK